MCDIEYDSDEETEYKETASAQASLSKQAYTRTARNVSSKKFKKSDEVRVDEYDSDDDEYGKMLQAPDVDSEDEFERQLRLEKEEGERLKTEGEKKTKIDPDGTEYEWDPAVKGWFPKVPDKQLFEYQQQSYVNVPQYDKKLLENTYYRYNEQFYTWDFEKNAWKTPETNAIYAYVDYATGIKFEWNQEDQEWQGKNLPAPAKVENKKDSKNKADVSNLLPVKKKEGWVDVDDDKNTNVYVSGLPMDVTDEEFEEMMSKYGIIMKDVLSHKLKLKLYRGEDNEVKGDGRCCYLMPESVKLCIQLLDGSDYKGHKLKVEKAKFELKGKYDPTKAGVINEAQKKKLSKKKEKQALDKQRKRLLDWDERPTVKREKHEKVVVIKGLYSVDEIKKDYDLIKKIKDDLRTALEQYGEVKKILIHENNQEGVATVSFREIEMADRCCEYMDNRVWRNGRVISCETWDGETKYEVEETEEERQKRIADWHKFLETSDV